MRCRFCISAIAFVLAIDAKLQSIETDVDCFGSERCANAWQITKVIKIDHLFARQIGKQMQKLFKAPCDYH